MRVVDETKSSLSRHRNWSKKMIGWLDNEQTAFSTSKQQSRAVPERAIFIFLEKNGKREQKETKRLIIKSYSFSSPPCILMSRQFVSLYFFTFVQNATHFLFYNLIILRLPLNRKNTEEYIFFGMNDDDCHWLWVIQRVVLYIRRGFMYVRVRAH